MPKSEGRGDGKEDIIFIAAQEPSDLGCGFGPHLFRIPLLSAELEKKMRFLYLRMCLA